jgi:uncharacterized protein
MKNLLEFLLIHLVDHPEDVSIEEYEDDRGMVYRLHVHADDIGRVIGKNGSVIQSIRNIAKIRAVKEGIRAHVTIADQEVSATAANADSAPAEVAETEVTAE